MREERSTNLPGLAEFLDRAPLSVDAEVGGGAIRGRSVLITGAGGSIGAALTRRVLSHDPSRLVLLELSEQALHRLTVDLAHAGSRVELLLGDAGDRALLRTVFDAHRPATVVHCAAHKHAPLLETQPLAALRNNVLATRALLDEARRGDAERFVMISTDKAVRPAGIMGASKRLAELLLLAAAEDRPRTSVVRFGNVWGSSGSVVPRFLDQLAAGEALTVTDPEATRFFLDREEAVALVMVALASGRGRDILVPELGSPISILGIARRLLAASGVSEGDDRIRFIGLRPGDKRRESLLDPDEIREPADPAWIRRVVGPLPRPARVERWSDELETIVERNDAAAAIDHVRALLPDFVPSAALRAHAGAVPEAGSGRG